MYLYSQKHSSDKGSTSLIHQVGANKRHKTSVSQCYHLIDPIDMSFTISVESTAVKYLNRINMAKDRFTFLHNCVIYVDLALLNLSHFLIPPIAMLLLQFKDI